MTVDMFLHAAVLVNIYKHFAPLLTLRNQLGSARNQTVNGSGQSRFWKFCGRYGESTNATAAGMYRMDESLMYQRQLNCFPVSISYLDHSANINVGNV